VPWRCRGLNGTSSERSCPPFLWITLFESEVKLAFPL
jgi:hypothetical protein